MSHADRSPIKDPPLRLPGQSLVKQHNDLIDDRVVPAFLLPSVFIVLAALEWYRYFVPATPSPWTYTAVAAGAAAWGVWRVARTRPQLRQLRQAIEGERAVGQFLEILREKGYRVFHDVLGDGFNVDHILIGPAGVVTVETKTWSKPRGKEARIVFEQDQISAAGFEPDRNPLVQARAQARWIGNLLAESTGRVFAIRPAIVFPGWYVERRPNATRDCWVLEPKALPSFLDHEKPMLSAEDIAIAATHLSRLVRAGERGRLAATSS